MKTENVIVDKSRDFAIRVVRLYRYLTEQEKEFIMSKQLLRSGTSIGANIKEAVRGHTKKEFSAKMAIALKEASETEYWLELLCATNYLTRTQYEAINNDCSEILRLLMSIVKTANRKNS